MIDASHGNSGKDHTRQPGVVRDIAARLAAGERGIAGVMMESFLVAGRQDLGGETWSAASRSPTPASTGTPRRPCSTSWPRRFARAADP